MFNAFGTVFVNMPSKLKVTQISTVLQEFHFITQKQYYYGIRKLS